MTNYDIMIEQYLADAKLLEKFDGPDGAENKCAIGLHLKNASSLTGQTVQRIFIDTIPSPTGAGTVLDDLTVFFEDYIYSAKDPFLVPTLKASTGLDSRQSAVGIILDYTKNSIHGLRLHANRAELLSEDFNRATVSESDAVQLTFVLRGANVHVDQSRWMFQGCGSNGLELLKITREFVMKNMNPSRSS